MFDTGVALVTTLVEPTTTRSTTAELVVGWIDNVTLGAPGTGWFCDGGCGDRRRVRTLRIAHRHALCPRVLKLRVTRIAALPFPTTTRNARVEFAGFRDHTTLGA